MTGPARHDSEPPRGRDRVLGARRLALRAVTFAGVWLVLAEGSLRGWGFGVAGVVASTAVSAVVLPPDPRRRISLVGVARLTVFFLVSSIAGGIDVARRAFHPRLPIRPGMVDVGLSEDDDAVRAGLAALVSVLPGTVCVTVEGDHMQIHGLDVGADVAATVAEAERRLASALTAGAQAEETGSGRSRRR